jgi:hypothetical protein
MYDCVICEAADETSAFLANDKQFDNIRRYATSIENAYHRSIEQLRRIQKDRKKERAQPVGFVSQTPKIVPILDQMVLEPRPSTGAAVPQISGDGSFGRPQRC